MKYWWICVIIDEEINEERDVLLREKKNENLENLR